MKNTLNQKNTMKKLLFILMLGCQGAFAQPNANCSIKQIGNDTVHPGDSAWAGIIAVDAYPAALTDMCHIQIGTPNLSNTAVLFSATYWSLMTGPKYFYNGDSLSMCKFVIPTSWQPGPAKYFVKNNSAPIVVIATPTGIQEQDRTKIIVRSEMYDLMGRRISHPEGIYVRVDYFLDGSTSTSKIYKP